MPSSSSGGLPGAGKKAGMESVAALTVEYFEQRMGQVDQRLDQIDRRLDQVDRRLDQVEQRLDAVDQRFVHFECLIVERFERRLAETRVDILKWSFLFWVGQVAAVAAMLSFALRSLPR